MPALPRLWPADLPRIRLDYYQRLQGYVQQLQHIERTSKIRLDTHSTSQDSEAFAYSLKHGQLWWVAEGMCALATQARHDLPAWSPHQVAPSPGGLVAYAAGTGITLPWLDAASKHTSMDAFGKRRYPQVRVRGLIWGTDTRGRLELVPLTDDPRVITQLGMKGRLAPMASPNAYIGEDGAALSPAMQPLWDLLGTTWILAVQPGIGTQRPWSARRGDPGKAPQSKPGHASSLQIITLREAPYAPPSPTPEQQKGTGTPLDHRVLVRGHWRNTACGPHRDSHRPTYIAPYIKGPQEAPLRTPSETIYLWKR